MNEAESLNQIRIHQQECSLRYQMIEQRLERGSARMARLETLIWSMYPFILATIYFSKDL